MRANRCHTYCLERDYSTNKIIFKPIRKECDGCEYLKKRLLDEKLNIFIKSQKIKEEK